MGQNLVNTGKILLFKHLKTFYIHFSAGSLLSPKFPSCASPSSSKAPFQTQYLFTRVSVLLCFSSRAALIFFFPSFFFFLACIPTPLHADIFLLPSLRHWLCFIYDPGPSPCQHPLENHQGQSESAAWGPVGQCWAGGGQEVSVTSVAPSLFV